MGWFTSMNFSNSNWWFCLSTVRKLHFRIDCSTTYLRHRDHYNPWNGKPMFDHPKTHWALLMEVFWTLYHIRHSDIPLFPSITNFPQKCFNLGFFPLIGSAQKKKHDLRGQRLKWKKKASNSDLRVLWWSAFLGQKRFVSWVSWWCQTDQRGVGVTKILVKNAKKTLELYNISWDILRLHYLYRCYSH